MRAVVIDSPAVARIAEWVTPDPLSGEVIVRVQSVGVCAGDMHIFTGKNPYARYPCIGGHEIAGTIHSLGPEVAGWEVGERVVVEPFISCGRCYPCRVGKRNCCANLSILGIHRPGGFAEFVAAPAANIHAIPVGLSFLWASFAEPLAIAVQACRRAHLADELCLVLGCGPIGLALIEVALARGANVLATDLDPSRLSMATQLGAETRIMDATFEDWLMRSTSGEGIPVVFEATGVSDVVTLGFKLVASGGRLVVLGLVPEGTEIALPGLDITRKEATILGSRASSNCFPEALHLLVDGQITYPSIASELSMWEAPDIMRRLADSPGAIHKAVLVP